MPLALSAICEHAQKCSEIGLLLREPLANGGNVKHLATSISVPLVTRGSLAVLKECIEYFDDDPAEFIVSLFQKLQIQQARLTSFVADCCGKAAGGVILVVTEHQADENMYDAAHLYALAAQLFPYARGNTEEAPSPVLGSDLSRALQFFHIDDMQQPTVYRLISERHPDKGRSS